MIQVASDNFIRGGYPTALGGGDGWTEHPSSATTLNVVSAGVVEDAILATAARYYWSGLSWPADQYCQYTILKANVNAYYDFWVRLDSLANTGYVMELNSTSATQNVYVKVAGTTAANYTFTATIANNDVWMFMVQGTTLTAYQNSVLVFTQTDTNIASGSVGIGLTAFTALIDGQIGPWSGGANQAATPTFSPVAGSYSGPQIITITSSTPGGTIYYTTDGTTPTHSSSSISNGGTITLNASATVKAIASVSDFVDSTVGSAAYTITGASHYSVPDCRDYGYFPNSAINVNGTEIYTGQTSSNPAIPPVDSRVSKPIPCGTYPQNSRTPGTYGPGE